MIRDPAVENRPVLIVEDDIELAELIANRLSAEGYRATHVHTWKEAERVIGGGVPDLLIMDLNLPDADGMQIIESLRGNPRTDRLAVIVASARDDTDVMIRGVQSGVLYFITKPFDLEELVAKARSAVFQRFEMDNPGGNC